MEPSSEDQVRRAALKVLGGIGVVFYGASFLYPALRFLTSPQREDPRKLPREAKGPNVSGLSRRSAAMAPYGPQPAIVVRTGAGTLRGYLAVCTHLGCTVGYNGERGAIVCACHGAVFSEDDGSPLSGPAKTPLRPLEVAESADGETTLRLL